MPTRFHLAIGLSVIGSALLITGAAFLAPAAGFLVAGVLAVGFGLLLGVEFD